MMRLRRRLRSRSTRRPSSTRGALAALGLAASLATLALAPARAHACGGCFSPPDAVSTVTDHRMAIAISNQQTTLWDQIQYSGAPKDFVWVLPTPGPADVEVASPAFFDELDTQTRPQVIPPPMARATSGSSGFGCGSADRAAPAAADAGDQVTVYHQGKVGPYETATVGSDNPDALRAWLNDHGYGVPDAMKPTIAWYVQRKWVFEALRLRPEASSTQMTPVRVRFPGLAATFPLRMVAAGAAAKLGIVLWVIADQRYEAANYDTLPLDEKRLRWSLAERRSNYRELFDRTIAERGGRAFIVEYVQPYEPQRDSGDVATALMGQPSTVTLTRLRTSIAPALLSDDLVLAPAPSNARVSSQHFLGRDQVVDGPVTAGGGAGWPALVVAAIGVALAARRRRRATVNARR